MPNIREENAPENLGLNPTEMGVDARAAVARRGGAFYNQAAEAITSTGQRIASTVRDVGQVADDYMTHRDISKGAAEGTAIVANANTNWNETAKKADPNDPATAQKFLTETLEPALDKFKEGFTTERSQQWAEQFTSQYRKHMFEKTASDMSTLAGIAVQQNVHKTVNQLSSAAASDPSSLDFALKTIDHSIGGMVSSSPNLDAATSAKVNAQLTQDAKEQVVKSAVSGMLQKNPDMDLSEVQRRYGEFIKGDEMQTFQRAAKTYKRLEQSETRSARVMGDYEAKQEFNKASNDLELSTLPKNPMDRPTLPKDYWENIKKLAMLPGAALDPGRLKSMVENGEKITDRLSKPEPMGPVSHDTTINLMNRIRATDQTRLNTNDEIYKAYGEGKLNTADFNFLQKEFKDLRTPEGEKLGARQEDFIKSVAPMIDKSNPLMGKIDPSGKQGIYRLTVDLNTKIDEYRKAGKDPYDLLNPAKPDYMGSPAALEQYQKPLQQSLQDVAKRLRGGGGVPAQDSVTGVQVESAPVATSIPRPAAPKPPEKGFVKDGYEFLGGSPGEAANWRKVGT